MRAHLRHRDLNSHVDVEELGGDILVADRCRRQHGFMHVEEERVQPYGRE